MTASDTGSSSGWAGSLARWRIQRRRAGLARRRIGSRRATLRLLATLLLPLMILANLFALFFTVGKGGAAGLGEVVNFASLGGRRVGGGSQRMTFGDVAGVDEALVELREIVEYLKSPEKFQRLGASP